MRQSRGQHRMQNERVATVTWVIFALCVIPELVLIGADQGFWGQTYWRGAAYQYGAFWAGLLFDWHPNYLLQPWLMFATYGFLHGGLIHLALNMAALLSLAQPLHRWFGSRRFVLLYGVSLIGGGLGFALLGPDDVPMIGASGALFGLSGAFLAHEFARRKRVGATLRPIFRALALLIALNVVLWWALQGQLAWETHLGGFIAGWAAAALMRNR